MARPKPKRNRSTIYMSIFLALIMVSSIIGFVGFAGDSSTTARYNGIKFSLTQEGWQAKIEGQRYTFSYIPQDVEHIPSPPLPPSLQQFALTSDINASFPQAIAQAQFSFQSAAAQRGIPSVAGFTEENPFSLPILTCANATPAFPVFYYQQGLRKGISQEDSCVLIEAPAAYDFIQLTDRLTYQLLGVLP